MKRYKQNSTFRAKVLRREVSGELPGLLFKSPTALPTLEMLLRDKAGFLRM